ncbi:MAG TPA: DHH family phosphoesterase, partial [Candidatus Jeotgalicoccus stercoravium]|nr:DHH family phosphoesterase [Candidatus Jeotgalicoccus stercoravium]
MFKELTQNLNELNSRSEAVKEMIESHKEIVILRHQRPDPDAYGSQLGLKTYLQNKYPEKTVYAYGEGEASLSFLGSMDEEKELEDVLIIAVDTANLERLDGSLNSKKNLIKIDHHPDREQYGDVSIVEIAVSSTSELLYLLMRTWDEDAIDKDTAALLYMGIVGDTGRFLYNNTTELTLLVASKLIKY